MQRKDISDAVQADVCSLVGYVKVSVRLLLYRFVPVVSEHQGQ
jgi:hypothetical protein